MCRFCVGILKSISCNNELSVGNFMTDLGLYKNERVALFIDGANLYSAARTLGFDIDYKKLLDLFRAEGQLVRAFYYTALFEDQEYSPIRPLVDWLDYNGYTLVTKPAKEYTDAQGRRKVKGNMDIELAIDVLEMADRLDHVVLFSGDGDFRRLIEAVQRHGLRASVVSTIRTSPPMIADELRRQADNFIELQSIANAIARQAPDGGRGNRGRRDYRKSDYRDEDDADYSDDYEDDEFEDEYDDDVDDEAVVERVR